MAHHDTWLVCSHVFFWASMVITSGISFIWGLVIFADDTSTSYQTIWVWGGGLVLIVCCIIQLITVLVSHAHNEKTVEASNPGTILIYNPSLAFVYLMTLGFTVGVIGIINMNLTSGGIWSYQGPDTGANYYFHWYALFYVIWLLVVCGSAIIVIVVSRIAFEYRDTKVYWPAWFGHPELKQGVQPIPTSENSKNAAEAATGLGFSAKYS